MKQVEMMAEGMRMPTPSKAGVSGVTRVTDQAKPLKTLGNTHVTPRKRFSYTRGTLPLCVTRKAPRPPAGLSACSCRPMQIADSARTAGAWGNVDAA